MRLENCPSSFGSTSLKIHFERKTTTLTLARIVNLTGKAVLSASHLFVSVSSGKHTESVDNAPEHISRGISAFI
ncbi:hypothetical protein H1R20_g11115, partial [Candolleomyces eurysporus]